MLMQKISVEFCFGKESLSWMAMASRLNSSTQKLTLVPLNICFIPSALTSRHEVRAKEHNFKKGFLFYR